MTVPAEYERASAKFYEFLIAVRDHSGLWSTHVTYTMVQGVLQVFRLRLTTNEAIAFAQVLPIGLRALFITDWDPDEPRRPFESMEAMNREVRELRAEHNFSTDQAIESTAQALRKQVDPESLMHALEPLPKGASAFWGLDAAVGENTA